MARLRFYLRLGRLCAVVAAGLSLASGLKLVTLLGARPSPITRQRLCRWFLARLASALPYEIRVTGTRPEQPMLWLANHLSWTDIPLLGMLLPMTFLAKSEVRQWPLLGWLAAEAGTQFIQRGRGDSNALSQLLGAELLQGRHVLIFPEGTTTDGTALRAFHSRLLGCAIETGTPIQPVAIRYRRDEQADPIAPFIGDDDLLSHLFRLLAADTAIVEIQLLKPIASGAMDRNRLGRTCHTAIAEALHGRAAPLALAA